MPALSAKPDADRDARSGGEVVPGDDGRLDDLAQIIRAYNDVTTKLQSSHEALKAEVLRLRRELTAKDEQIQRQKRLSALGEMAAGIAHEVRNPIGAIGLFAAMVRDDIAAAAERQPCDDLAAAGANTQRIADSVRAVEGDRVGRPDVRSGDEAPLRVAPRG